MELTQEDLRQIEAGFHRDRYAGLRGPIHVDPSFLESLQRIDPRLVLRWIPWMGRYSIWIRLEHSKLLWPQPVLVVQDEKKEFRRPDNRDIEAVRRAAWIMRNSGSDGFIREMDRALSAREGKLADEHRTRAIQEWARWVAKRYDLTVEDFGVVRRGVGAGGEKNRHRVVKSSGGEME